MAPQPAAVTPPVAVRIKRADRPLDAWIEGEDAVWSEAGETRRASLAALRLAPCAQPAALYDFALTPAHLRAAARVMMRKEQPGGLGRLAGAVAARRYGDVLDDARIKFYVGNVAALSGPDDCVPWPANTAYLDIEPELAVLVGALPLGAGETEIVQALRGYTIFNDWSARDLQFPEMRTGTLGFMRAKHFASGNGLGPWLVPRERLGDPYALAVDVVVGGGRLRWSGTTRDYERRAEDALRVLTQITPLAENTLVGLGTIPGCCGLDTDQWLLPGEPVEIRIEGLGTLRQQAGQPRVPIDNRRWPRRPELRYR